MRRRGVLVGGALLLIGTALACVGSDPAVTSDPGDASVTPAPTTSTTSTPTPTPTTPDTGVDAALPTMVTFGERPTALFQNVTTDTEIHQAQPGLNYGSGANIDVSTYDAAEMVGLLRFELTVIPPERKVKHATLELWTSGDTGCGAAVDHLVSVFAVLEAWTEGTGNGDGEDAGTGATYQKRTPSTLWHNAGAGSPLSREDASAGDFGAEATAAEHTVDITALVSRWVANPLTNLGMALAFKSAEPKEIVCFVSSESPSPTSRPLLTIELEP